jgi:purine-nucleoside phosphorylase
MFKPTTIYNINFYRWCLFRDVQDSTISIKISTAGVFSEIVKIRDFIVPLAIRRESANLQFDQPVRMRDNEAGCVLCADFHVLHI